MQAQMNKANIDDLNKLAVLYFLCSNSANTLTPVFLKLFNKVFTISNYHH